MLANYMRRYFPKPDERHASVKEIDLQLLQARGYKVLFMDVDNTLALRKDSLVTDEALLFIEAAKGLGFRILLVSNVFAGRKRVNRIAKIAATIGADYVPAYWTAMKPHPKPFRNAIAKARCQPRQIAMIGDQIGTDVAGAKRVGIYAIKVEPLGPDHWATRPRRWLENKFAA